MAKRQQPGCGCCGGNTCSWFGTGAAPDHLYWTDPYLGSFTLDIQNGSAVPGINCYWQWCGTVDMPATTECSAITGVNLAITLALIGGLWAVRYSWAVSGSICTFTAFCPALGTSAVCTNYASQFQIMSGTGFTSGVFGVTFTARPYAQTWNITNMSLSQSYAKLAGQSGCAGTFGNTWSISE